MCAHCLVTEPIPDQLFKILGEPIVDSAIDCVGFEARGCGHHHHEERPAQVLNDLMQVTKAGGQIGIPGLYVTEDPGAHSKEVRTERIAVMGLRLCNAGAARIAVVAHRPRVGQEHQLRNWAVPRPQVPQGTGQCHPVR